MARAQHQISDDIVIEETPQAGVFRRRRIGLVERWADEGIVTEKELAAAEAFQVMAWTSTASCIATATVVGPEAFGVNSTAYSPAPA